MYTIQCGTEKITAKNVVRRCILNIEYCFVNTLAQLNYKGLVYGKRFQMEVIMEGEKYVVEINDIFMCTLHKYFDGIQRITCMSCKYQSRGPEIHATLLTVLAIKLHIKSYHGVFQLYETLSNYSG